VALLHGARCVDLTPAQVWAQRLDTGQAPLCSIRSPENVERFIRPVLSGRTVEAVIFL